MVTTRCGGRDITKKNAPPPVETCKGDESMKVSINAGFGFPLSEEDRSWIIGRGFHGVRSDYGPGVLGALFYTRLQPLILACSKSVSAEFIADRVAQICREIRNLGYHNNRSAPLPAIEPFNEPDIDPYWKTRPRMMADVVWKCWQIANSFHCGVKLITPGVSNLNERGLNYLEEMVNAGIPDDVAVGFHRYPPGDDPSIAHDGFASRWAEVERLKFLASKRKLWCTETGWTSGPRKKRRRSPLCFLERNVWLTEDKVAANAATELRFWARVPQLEAVVYYQINDGPNWNNPEDNFGLRSYPDRTNKVLARWMPELIQEVTS